MLVNEFVVRQKCVYSTFLQIVDGAETSFLYVSTQKANITGYLQGHLGTSPDDFAGAKTGSFSTGSRIISIRDKNDQNR